MMQGTVHLFDHLPEVDRPAMLRAGGVAAPMRSSPLVGVIRNPRSHRNIDAEPEWSGRATLMVETPRKRSELEPILRSFAEAQVDFIVVDGGDGTVRDVLTCGAGLFGESWPPLIVLPSGKTNALAIDLALCRGWNLDEAITAARDGRVAIRRPLVISMRDNPDARVQGFVFGAGAFTAAIGLGQSAHRRGAFDALGVGLTAAWSVLQAMFGAPGNIWKRGTPMRLRFADGRAVAHSGRGRADERYMIFGSTLGKFPAGLQPFRGVGGRLRFNVLDSANLGLLMRMPVIYFGKVSAAARRLGMHQFGADRLDIDLAGNFILDGEAFPPGSYTIELGPTLRFVVP